jgi:hypothetical protein
MSSDDQMLLDDNEIIFTTENAKIRHGKMQKLLISKMQWVMVYRSTVHCVTYSSVLECNV